MSKIGSDGLLLKVEPLGPREIGDCMGTLLRELATELPSTDIFELFRLKIPMAAALHEA
jgi:hypothetical protein